MHKKGQVTIFIVIGILILGVVLGMVYVSQHLVKEEVEAEEERVKEVSFTADSVRMFVEGCLEDTAEDSILAIGKQGGYHELMNKPLDMFFFNLIPYITDETGPTSNQIVFMPYYFQLGASNFPELETIEKELSESIEAGLPACLGDFAVFKEQGFEFILGDVSVSSAINPGRVTVNLDYPMGIKKGSSIINLESFSKTIKFDFKEKYDLVGRLIAEQKKKPDLLPLGFLTDLAYENDFTFEAVDFEESVVQFNLIFENDVFEFPFIYSFMFWYDWGSQSSLEFASAGNEEFVLQGDSALTGLAALDYEGDVVLFSDEDIGEELEGDWWSDSEQVNTMGNAELLREINGNPSLLNEPAVQNNVNERIQTDIAFLNEDLNDQAKSIWYSQFNMFCENCKLTSFDGSRAVTEGEGVSVNLYKLKNLYPGSTITEFGDVRLANGAEIRKGKVTIFEVGKVLVEGEDSFLDLSKAERLGTYANKGGSIQIGRNILSTDDPKGIIVTTRHVGLEIFGKDVILEGPEENTNELVKEADFTGKVILHKDYEKTKHMTFGAGSKITFYESSSIVDIVTKETKITSNPSISYEVSKDAEYYDKHYMCTLAEKSCITRNLDEGYFRVVPKDDIKINIKTHDVMINDYEVALIEDDSEVNFNYVGKVSFHFTKEPVKVKGDISEFDDTLNSYIEKPKVNQVCRQSIGSSGVSQGCMGKFEYTGMQTAREFKELHEALIEERKYGAFYGQAWGTKWRMKKLEKELGVENVPIETSCIGYVTQVMSETLKKLDDPEAAKHFLNIVKKYKNRGNFIFKDLVEESSWEGVYFNKNTRYIKENFGDVITETPEQKALLEKNTKRIQWAINKKENPTYGIDDYAVPVQEKVTNYGKMKPTDQSQEDLEMLKEIPFALLTEKQGFHCAILSYGEVYEVHYYKGPKSPELFEITPIEDWKPSGLVVAPEGAIERAKASLEAKRESASIAEAAGEESGSSS